MNKFKLLLGEDLFKLLFNYVRNKFNIVNIKLIYN